MEIDNLFRLLNVLNMHRLISQYVDSMFPPPWPSFCNLALFPPQSNLKPIKPCCYFLKALDFIALFFYVIICFSFFHFTFPFASSFGKSSASWTHARMLPLLFELSVSWFMNRHTHTHNTQKIALLNLECPFSTGNCKDATQKECPREMGEVQIINYLWLKSNKRPGFGRAVRILTDRQKSYLMQLHNTTIPWKTKKNKRREH